MTVEMIVDEKGLRPLISRPRVDASKATPGVPRWALDLSTHADHDLDWYYQCYGYDVYNADMGLEPLDLDVVSACISGKTLKLRGVRVGTIQCIQEGLRRPGCGWHQDIPLGETMQRWFETVEGKAGASVTVSDPYPAGYPRSEAFTRLMLGDTIRDLNQVPLNYPVEQFFSMVWALMNSETVHSDIHLTVHGMLFNQALVITDGGMIGTAHLESEVGDEIWVFGGGNIPFSLRPRKSSHDAEYDFIGQCYVQGIMQGEGFANDSSQKPYEQTVVIY
jgi:hypothetical protein